MNISRTYLERYAATTGYLPTTLEQVWQLGRIATALSNHPLLQKMLLLKGGTAFNLCFEEAPTRLSVDLDYNYVGSSERDAMLAARPQVEEIITALLQRLNFRVQYSGHAFAGRKIYSGYTSVLGPENRVEVDLNYLWRIPLADAEKRDMWQFGELDRPNVRTVSLVELCIGKLLAFLDRSAPRDAWDIGRFSELAGEIIRMSSFRPLFIAMSATLPHPLYTYTHEHIAARITERLIREQLQPMLPANAVPDRERLVERAWSVAKPFVELADHELGYVNGIQQGHIDASPLFPDDAILCNRIATHPAIRWKVANVLRQKE